MDYCNILTEIKLENAERLTSGFTQAGVWLVRHCVSNSNPRSRPNRSAPPACVKPPPR